MLRHLVDENMKGKHANPLAFGDPHMLSMQTISYERDAVRDYVVRLLSEYSARDSILLPFNTG
jgi:hypothetical protein